MREIHHENELTAEEIRQLLRDYSEDQLLAHGLNRGELQNRLTDLAQDEHNQVMSEFSPTKWYGK